MVEKANDQRKERLKNLKVYEKKKLQWNPSITKPKKFVQYISLFWTETFVNLYHLKFYILINIFKPFYICRTNNNIKLLFKKITLKSHEKFVYQI